MAAYRNPIPCVDSPEVTKDHDIYTNITEYSCKESVYFAFIDVLGFKKAFDDDRLDKDNNHADKYKKVFEYYIALMSWWNYSTRSEKRPFYAGQTSDSLYFYTERVDVLIEFLKIFSHFNVYAMTQDVFFRGGIAKGRLYHKEDYQFYGDSVINAYLLESEISRNPIIMIDENTYKTIKESISVSKNWIITRDERHFLGPFAYLEHNFTLEVEDPMNKIFEIDQKALRKMIEDNKRKFEYDPKNYDKYVFLSKEYTEYKKRNGIK